MGRPDEAIESRRLAETIGNAVECPADLYGPKLRYLVNLRERDKPAQGKRKRQSSSNSIMRGSEEGGTDNLQLSSEGGVFNCAEDG